MYVMHLEKFSTDSFIKNTKTDLILNLTHICTIVVFVTNFRKIIKALKIKELT